MYFFQHADSLINQVTILANTSLCIPRYFYQVLQSTTVKLSITPQPRVLGESVSVPHGSQLAVKVEGVVQHGGKPGLFRSVKEVIVTVTSVPQTRINHDLQVRFYNFFLFCFLVSLKKFCFLGAK